MSALTVFAAHDPRNPVLQTRELPDRFQHGLHRQVNAGTQGQRCQRIGIIVLTANSHFRGLQQQLVGGTKILLTLFGA